MSELQGPNSETKPVSVAEYSDAVESVQLRDIRLIGSDFDVKPEAFLPEQDGWKSGYSCEVVNAFCDIEADLLTGFIEADAHIKCGRRKILSLRSKYLLVYDIHGKPKEEAAEKFVRHVGAFATYPYFRAHFAQLVSEAGLRLPPLPVMKEGRRRIRDQWEEDSDGGTVD